MVTRAVLFDLFDTLVRFTVRVPIVRVAGTDRRTTMPWLADAFRHQLPDVDFDQFLETITVVTREIIKGRAPEQLEVPSRIRFERALRRLGLPAPVAQANAAPLSLVHMQHLAASVELPAGHLELLASLSPKYLLGLVSNLDHAATARGLLEKFGLARFLRTMVISEEFGRRKPHPTIFHEALKQIDVEPADAIFVGDSLTDDVAGAKNVGMRVVWLNPEGRPLPEGMPAPDANVRSLLDLSDLLSPRD
jgi:HAD superfamily hydrolase (TIGR01549 family)